jgi:hypothetical protein
MNIWAVSCLFAFTPSHFRIKNYKTFRENLKKHDVKLLTVEFNPEGKFELTNEDADKLIQLSDGDIMWQKERLINIGIDNLPTDTDIVLVLDTDIIFSHEDMIERIKKSMEQYKVVQCYSRTMQLNPLITLLKDKLNYFNIDNSKEYFFHGINRQSYMSGFFGDQKHGDIGLAWAYRYETIKQIKMFEMNIIGSGDNATMSALLRQFKSHMIAGTANSWFLYADMIRKYVEVKDVNYLKDTIVYSLYHGEIESRGYRNRHDILTRHDFDSTKHLIVNEGLPFKFTDDVSPLLKEEIKQYFINRKENESLSF